MDKLRNIKCAVACTNAEGEPDLFFCRVTVSEPQYHDAVHYEMAKDLAGDHGYEAPFVVFDEDDSAFQKIEWGW